MGNARTNPRPACPTCGKPSEQRPQNQAFPFCSGPCKLVDLGRWLDGSYRIPGPPVSVEGAEQRSSLEEDE
jgi:uncharacterized protein